MKILLEFHLKLTLCILLSISFNPDNLHAQEAEIWKKYTGAITDPNIPVLPNYGYAGYKLGAEAIPETHSHPVFDVTDYGAVPNDANSDQSAIQAAIDAAEANGSGVVFFPPGEFLVNTDPSPSTSIRIESSNIILKGSGSTPGGTIINMKNQMQAPPGGGGIQPMFVFEMPWSASATSLLTQDADRGDMFITVQDASLLQGRKYCRMDMPNSLAANNQFLEGRSPQSTWTKVHNNGVAAIEYHEIESIDLASNRIYFKDPLVDDVKESHGWKARSIELMEGSGFEDIHFKANFTENFVHLKHVGWAAFKMERTAHSWVRRVRISNVTGVMAIRNSYALSVIQMLIDGNRGHTTVGTVVSTRVLAGLTWDNTNNGQWHGSGFATGANGSVVWRVDATKGEGPDLHGDMPRTNLLDLYTSVDLTGSGGAVQNFPHHLSGLTIWNHKRVGGSSVNNYNFWGSGWWLVNPIIVGYHGTSTTFVQSSLKYEESNSAKVSPESLYEAQVAHRLGAKPAWIDAAIAEYESLKTAWYAPADPEPVAGVTVSPTTYTLGLGLTIDLTETIYPSNAANKAVSWSSSNTSVATVNSDGLVTGVAEGDATITVTTADGGFTATSTVTVTPVTGISVSPTFQVNIYPNPVNGGALNVEVAWSSSSEIALRIFNIMGNMVYSETIGRHKPGSYTFTRNTKALKMDMPGVYIIEVKANEHVERKKVILK